MARNTVTKTQARDLAVRYYNYMTSCSERNDNSIALWGDMLLNSQTATGIEVVDPVLIETIVQNARRHLNEKEYDRACEHERWSND